MSVLVCMYCVNWLSCLSRSTLRNVLVNCRQLCCQERERPTNCTYLSSVFLVDFFDIFVIPKVRFILRVNHTESVPSTLY